MRTIDLNADLGELVDGSLDAAVMPFISSANIACGGHAGGAESMRRTVRSAVAHGVKIGAHPGYNDPENFGRVSCALSDEALCSLVVDQVQLLRSIAEEEGAEVYHVKLHGALYNDLAWDYERSLLVSRAIAALDPQLRFLVFSNSETARAADDAGLVVIHEVFADRAYTESGRLVPRTQPGAVLHDEDACIAQVSELVHGNQLKLPADSVCVHGDNPSAIQFVVRLREFFAAQGIGVRAGGQFHFSFSRLGECALLARLQPRISRAFNRVILGLMAS